MTDLKRRAGIDPGSQLGWAVIEYTSAGVVDLVSSGTLDGRPAGGLSLVRKELTSILEVATLPPAGLAGISTEELLETKGERPTHCPKLAYWVEGVVRQLLEEEGWPPVRHYPAATIRRIIGCRDKAQVRKFVEAVLGQELKGRPDHESDAIGIALAGMMREDGIFPRLRWQIELTRKQAGLFIAKQKQSPSAERQKEPEVLDLRDPAVKRELMEALGKGRARIAPRRR